MLTIAEKLRNKRICIVIPSRNEEKRIRQALCELKESFKKHDLPDPLILLSDDSKDRTRAIAREEGAVIVNGGGKGLGYAMYIGLKAALDYEPDFILSYDADGQSDPDELPRFLEILSDDEADLVLASRFSREGLVKYKYPLINRFGTVVLSVILRAFTGLPLTDSHGGIRAMKPEVARELEMLGTHTYVQETIIDADQKGFRIKEIPSVWRKRDVGRSRVVASIPTYVFYTLPILILRSKAHLKWVYTIGILFVVSALVYFGLVFWEEGFKIAELFKRIPALLLVTILIIMGTQLFFFGFVLQLLKDIKYMVDKSVHKR